jgi:hypothetical protein
VSRIRTRVRVRNRWRVGVSRGRRGSINRVSPTLLLLLHAPPKGVMLPARQPHAPSCLLWREVWIGQNRSIPAHRAPPSRGSRLSRYVIHLELHRGGLVWAVWWLLWLWLGLGARSLVVVLLVVRHLLRILVVVRLVMWLVHMCACRGGGYGGSSSASRCRVVRQLDVSWDADHVQQVVRDPESILRR